MDSNLRRVKRTLITAALAVATVLAGCGTTAVSMVVVRPATINARPHGGTVTVQRVDHADPRYRFVAGQIGQELKRQILESVGSVVRLREYGGGLVVKPLIERYDTQLEQRKRTAKCTDEVKVTKGGVETTAKVRRDCIKRSLRWRAQVAVVMKVESARGEVLFWRRIVEEDDGSTSEVRDRSPTPPSLHSELRRLRRKVVERMAQVVAPYRERVTASFYDCPKPAEKVCAAAVRSFAKSMYDDALEGYDRAMESLEKHPNGSAKVRAKVHANRALVYRYSRRFDAAVRELRRASELDPSTSRYRNELERVEKSRNEHNNLVEQGLGK